MEAKEVVAGAKALETTVPGTTEAMVREALTRAEAVVVAEAKVLELTWAESGAQVTWVVKLTLR